MREIKFKVWIPYSGIMMQPKDIQTIHESVLTGITIGQFKQWVYLQFTGLKDKNGKDIYEGDILIDTLTKMTYVVKFGKCKKFAYNGWYVENDNNNYQTSINGDYDTEANSQIEITGNIYEN